MEVTLTSELQLMLAIKVVGFTVFNGAWDEQPFQATEPVGVDVEHQELQRFAECCTS